MMSTRLMIGLGIVYAIIVACALVERQWWRALYFTGAILITVSILGMGGR
jgi:hypothetical protein